MDEKKLKAKLKKIELENHVVKVQYKMVEVYPDTLNIIKQKILNLKVNEDFQVKIDLKLDVLEHESLLSIEFAKNDQMEVSTENVKDINVGIREIIQEEEIEIVKY